MSWIEVAVIVIKTIKIVKNMILGERQFAIKDIEDNIKAAGSPDLKIF